MKTLTSFQEAMRLTRTHIDTTYRETLKLENLTGRILSSDLVSKVDSPSLDSSIKDGYAVRSEELISACEKTPVTLHVVGQISAGELSDLYLHPGKTARITSGAAIPQGADAVLSEEFTFRSGDSILCHNRAEPGRNILPRGCDIRIGDTAAKKGEKITPALIGLIAAAGLDRAEVYRNPLVCVIATGDEIVAPGLPLSEGKLYASNITEILAWLTLFGIHAEIAYVKDNKDDIVQTIKEHSPHVDAFITSGGIWGSEKDMMTQALSGLNWKCVFHGVRMGPGKAVAFGLVDEKPFFCLPGGPPSNEMAFLQIALPALLKMRGESLAPFPGIRAILSSEVRGDIDWTQFIHARVTKDKESYVATPLKQASRLQSMATKNALIVLPEGCERLVSGSMVDVQILDAAALCEI